MRKYNSRVKRDDSLFGNALKYTAVLSAAALVLFAGARVAKGLESIAHEKTEKAVAENSCTKEDVVADKYSSYHRWTKEAINNSNDLGAQRGFDGVYDYISGMNDNREVVTGGSYKVVKCRRS